MAIAQPPASEVLDLVEQQESVACAWVGIRFQVPVAYVSHFPPSSGDQLRIDVQMLHRPEAFTRGMREATQVSVHGPFTIRWVNFEAATFGRGTLYIDFSSVTQFDVGPGRDGRSIVISLPAEQGVAACTPASLHERQ